MENYLKKINHKIAEHCTEEKARKIKKNCLIAGSVVLVIGLAGFISCFVSFLVLFLRFETELAMTLWFIAIPFILCVVIGSIVTRIGDAILIEKMKIANVAKTNAIESGYSDEIAESDNNAVEKEGGENKIETYKNCIDNDINMMNSESKGDIHNDDKAKDSPSLENSIQKETFKKEKMKNTRKRN